MIELKAVVLIIYNRPYRAQKQIESKVVRSGNPWRSLMCEK